MARQWLVGLLGCLVFLGALLLGALASRFGRFDWRAWLSAVLSRSGRERLQRRLVHAGLTGWHCADVVALSLAGAFIGAALAWIGSARLMGCAITALLGAWLPMIWLHQRVKAHQALLTAELPFFLDLLVMCLASGFNLQSAIQLVLEYQPRTALGDLWRRWLASVRAQTGRLAAFQQLMANVSAPAVRRVCVAMIQAEHSGAGVAATLNAQATQLRRDRLLQAERQALQAPVKMLLPLVICFFPSTFLVLGFAMWLSLNEAGTIEFQ